MPEPILFQKMAGILFRIMIKNNSSFYFVMWSLTFKDRCTCAIAIMDTLGHLVPSCDDDRSTHINLQSKWFCESWFWFLPFFVTCGVGCWHPRSNHSMRSELSPTQRPEITAIRQYVILASQIHCAWVKYSKTSYLTSVRDFNVWESMRPGQVFVHRSAEGDLSAVKANCWEKNVFSNLLTLLVRSLSCVVNWSRRVWTSPVGCNESNRDSRVLNRLSTSPRF